MKPTIAFLLSFFFTVAITRAQVNFGITAGINSANQRSTYDNKDITTGSITGLSAGIFVNIPAGKHFAFLPAFNYIPKGATDQILGTAVTIR